MNGFWLRILFSNSPDSIAFALKRISAWQRRGCLPAAIEGTAYIIEIKQMDPYCRVEEDHCNDNSRSERMLAHLYCMAIIRLVNGLIEKTRKKEETSIAVAAEAIGMPRTVIDIRHEASHRGLPSLQLLRSASVKALDWLKSYYWEPQSKAIPFEGDGNAKVRKKIKSKLQELSSCLKSDQSPQSNSPIPEGKRSKKQVSKISKSLVQLHSSYSSEIVDLLLEYLLKALSSSELVEHTEHASLGPTINAILADWKVVILRFWDKEPELILNLLKEVLIMIETQEAMKYEEEWNTLKSLGQGLWLKNGTHVQSACCPAPLVHPAIFLRLIILIIGKTFMNWIGSRLKKPSKYGVKRDATLDITLLDESTVKKKRETEQVSELDHDVLSPIKAKGCLLVDGVWKSVTEEEFRAIKSSVRILV